MPKPPAEPPPALPPPIRGPRETVADRVAWLFVLGYCAALAVFTLGMMLAVAWMGGPGQ